MASALVEDVSNASQCTIVCKYLVGADGARSFVRERLGFDYEGESGVIRDFLGGTMYAVYLRAPEFYRTVRHDPAWMNVTFNPDRRAFMAAVDGLGEFAFHTQLREGEDARSITEDGAKSLFQAAVGMRIDAQVLSRGTWSAGHALVANKYKSGRIILGGDAAHLFTPTGGLGYNTAVEDAVNLAWKLASVIRGVSAPRLLETYEIERRPIAIRNTTFARHFADSIGVKAAPEIEDEGPLGIRHAAMLPFTCDGTRRRNSISPALPSGGVTTGLRLSNLTEPHPPRIKQTNTRRQLARAAGRLTFGSIMPFRSMTRLGPNGRCSA
jgi:2-polyprenyl-6-methoxyphenol hydroxylase-like FAD-dependent oxidoreductase